MRGACVALGLLACAAPPMAPPPASAPPLPVADVDLPSCPSDLPPATAVSRDVVVSVVLGPGVTPEQAGARLGIARTIWGREGVALHVVPDVGHTTASAALVGAGADPVEWTAPMRGVIAEHASPAQGRVVVVLLPRVLDPASPLARSVDALDGYTWTPTDAGPVAQAVRAPADADPVVFVGLEAARRIPASHPDTTLAHELGHALGLSHSGRVGDLMTLGSPGCLPTLDARERALVLAGTP